MNGLEDALKKFMAYNPDLPAGEDVAMPEKDEPKRCADKLAVAIERKGRGGKTATIISGFTMSDDEIASLAREMKSRLGTGGSSRGGEILIQGERRREVIDYLRAKGFKING